MTTTMTTTKIRHFDHYKKLDIFKKIFYVEEVLIKLKQKQKNILKFISGF